MAILNATAALLATLLPSPQDPGAARPTTVPHAESLPADTMVAFAIRAGRDERQQLEATGLTTTLREILASGPVGEIATAADSWLGSNGLSLDAVLTSGVTLALHGDSMSSPDWVLATSGTLSDSLRESLTANGATLDDVSNGSIAEVTGAPSVWLGFGNDKILAAGRRDTVEQLLEAGGRHLSDNPRFRQFESRRANSSPVATMWVDAKTLLQMASLEMPRSMREQFDPVMTRLGIGAMTSVAWTASAANGRVHEQIDVGMPSPRPALIEALFPSTPVNPTAIASLAPADCDTFHFAALDLPRIWSEVRAAVAEVDPNSASQLEDLIAAANEHAGLDLEKDVLGALGAQMATVQFPSERGEARGGVIFALKDPVRITSALSSLPDVSRSRAGSFELFLSNDPNGLAMAIGPDHLILAQTEDGLRDWLERIRNGSAQERAPQASLMFGWANVEQNLRVATDQAGTMSDAGLEFLGYVERGAAALGTVNYRVTGDRQGYTVHVDSVTGSIGGILTAAHKPLTNWAATDAVVQGLVATVREQRTNESSNIARALELVAQGQAARRESNGTYTDLDTLVAEGHVDPSLMGTQVEPGRWQIGSWLLQAVLPEETGDHFAVVAWPASSRSGTLIARTDRHPAMSNDVLASSEGLATVRARDVFLAGDFAGSLTPGWRPMREAGQSTAVTSETENEFARLAAVEAAGEERIGELPGFLESSHDAVVARAAWLAGQNAFGAAAAQLGSLVETHQNVEVRRHAMAALRKIGDDVAETVAIHALSDEDAVVRTQAAVLLGQRRAKAAASALVEVLHKNVERDEQAQDRKAALLALADIGDPSKLSPSASLLTNPVGEEGQALAFLFQSLSRKLGDNETKVLMSVLEHRAPLLRRYAIQRLGELGDAKSSKALEARLEKETDALRPLVQVALNAVKQANTSTLETALATDRPATTAESNADVTTIAIAAGAFVVVLVIAIAISRRRRRMSAEEWVDMVNPSDEYEAANATAAEQEDDDMWEGDLQSTDDATEAWSDEEEDAWQADTEETEDVYEESLTGDDETR